MAKKWRDEFDDRQRKQIEWAEKYTNETDADGKPLWKHGANGHNDLVIIGAMAALLDKDAALELSPAQGSAFTLVNETNALRGYLKSYNDTHEGEEIYVHNLRKGDLYLASHNLDGRAVFFLLDMGCNVECAGSRCSLDAMTPTLWNVARDISENKG